MKLEELMRLAFNAGRDDVDGFDAWWTSEGEERHDEFLDEQTVGEDDAPSDP